MIAGSAVATKQEQTSTRAKYSIMLGIEKFISYMTFGYNQASDMPQITVTQKKKPTKSNNNPHFSLRAISHSLDLPRLKIDLSRSQQMFSFLILLNEIAAGTAP